MVRWLIALAAAPVALGASYLMALAGEPSSGWLWRDVLGVL